MATTGTDVRNINVSELRGIIVDSDEIKKGTELYDRKALENLSRSGNKLYCQAKGSDVSPYRVTLTFSEGSADIKAKCTCPAAWSSRKAFCKHAAALLVAWSRAPEAFVVGDPRAEGAAKKTTVKKGAVQKGDLMKEGIAQVGTLVRELGVAGIATGSVDRIEPIKKLGEALRENKLIRLSARTLALAKLLESAAAKKGAFPALDYTDLLADMLLTTKKLEKHLGGEPIEARHVEELIGKTWQKNDLAPVSGLDLLEYAYLRDTTPDNYSISESRYLDLTSGVHYSEKKIAPPPPAPKQEPKASHAGIVLTGLRGAVYPTYPPIRLKITDLGDPRPSDHDALARLIDKALPDVGSALAALQEHRKDVFAPDLLPAAIRVDTLLARGDRIQAVDATGNALHLPSDGKIEERLGTALHEGRLKVLIGNIGIDAALPTLWPLAAVFEGPDGLELRTLIDAELRVVRRNLGTTEPGVSAWITAARAAGAGAAAIALGEVREELADAFTLGLAGLSGRVTDPLSQRLRDLGLDKQAALLSGLIQKPEPEARLDDFVKLYQILGIALVRLAGATTVDRATIERVPTYESVFVARPAAYLHPDEVTALRYKGEINRYEAAVHYARYYEGLPAEELAEKIYPIWADGSAAPFVVRAFAGKREQGVAAAKRALAQRNGRVAKITAIQVLGAVGGREAEEILTKHPMIQRDAGLRARAKEARAAIEPLMIDRRSRESEATTLADLTRALLSVPSRKETRKQAIDEITTGGMFGAIPALRQAFLSDPAHDVREEAALALGLLGDTEMASTFVKMLAARAERPGDAAKAARALGSLGDVRGVHELCAAFVEDFQPRVLAEALRELGVIALEPLIAMLEAHPEIAERRTALDVLQELPDQDLAAALISRLGKRPRDESFPDVATLFLKLAAVHSYSRRVVAKAVLEMLPASEEQTAAGKAAKRALN